MFTCKEILLDTHELKPEDVLKNIEKYKIDDTKTICIFSNKGKYEIHDKKDKRNIEKVFETHIESYTLDLHTKTLGSIPLYVNKKTFHREKTSTISNEHKALMLQTTKYKMYLHSPVTLAYESMFDIESKVVYNKFYFMLEEHCDEMNEMISNEIVFFIEAIKQI